MKVGIGSAIVIAIVLLLGAWGVGMVLGYAWTPFHTAEKTLDAQYGVIDKTVTADNAIYNYEWFKQQYEDMQATKRKIINTQDQIKDFKATFGENASQWDYTTAQTYNQLQTQLTGQRNYYEDQAAKYNARAQMVNRNIFNDNLPGYVEAVLPAVVI